MRLMYRQEVIYIVVLSKITPVIPVKITMEAVGQ